MEYVVGVIVRVVAIQGVAHHPWLLIPLALFAALLIAGWRIQVREEAEALRAKRQEVVDLLARLRDRH